MTRVALVLLLYLFVVLTLPGTYPASQAPHDVWAFSMDDRLYMVPPLVRIFHGERPGFAAYGSFPFYVIAALFLPFILIHRAAGFADFSYVHYVMAFKITQIAVAATGLVVLFRLARRFCSPWPALACVLLVMTCEALYDWTFYLHPDVFQMTTVFASVLFLVRYLETRRLHALLLSGLFCGLATGSKYWGIFVAPVAMLSVAWTGGGAPTRRVVTHLPLYAATVLAAFVAFNVDFVTSLPAVLERARDYAVNHGAARFSVASPLLKYKVANVTSPRYFGALFVLAYLAVAARDLWRLGRARAGIGSEHVIHLSLVAVGAYYFLLYNDAFNLPEGERYLLAFVPLMVVPVAAAIEACIRRAGTLRWVGIAVVSVLAASQGLRLGGVPPSRLQLGQTDLQAIKRQVPFLANLMYYYQREQQGSFLVRRWVTGNVPPGSSVYVEPYLSISTLRHDDNRDLQLGAIYSDYVLVPEKLARYRADYAFTRYPEVARAIEGGHPYETVAVLGPPEINQVFVLRRVPPAPALRAPPAP